jgi:hypothetical protein
MSVVTEKGPAATNGRDPVKNDRTAKSINLQHIDSAAPAEPAIAKTAPNLSKNKPARINVEAANLHLRLLTGRNNPEVHFQVFHDAGKRPELAWHQAGTLEALHGRLAASQAKGCGVYVCVNETDGAGRRAENITRVRAAFVDFDGEPLPENWQIEPHLIVETSPDRFHAYWMIDPGTDFTSWTNLQARLASYYHGDPCVIDEPRVVRLAGFRHLKSAPFMVRIKSNVKPHEVDDDSFSRLTIQELAEAHPCDYSKPTRPETSNRNDEPAAGWDKPDAINRAISYLENVARLSVEGSHGDKTAFAVASAIRDLGVSQERALSLMFEYWNDRCDPPWQNEDLAIKVRNAYRYAHSNAGSNTPEADFADEAPSATQDEKNNVALRAKHPVFDAWVWVAQAGTFVRRSDCVKYDPKTFRSMYASLTPDRDLLVSIWKDQQPVRKFESIVYLPAAQEFPDGQKGRYNIWRPSGVQAKPGDVSWFLRHMEYMFPDESERDLVLDYLALLVQRPAEKLHFALLIVGTKHGAGKSAIGEIMKRIIGHRNVVTPANDEIIQNFTGWQEGAQLAIIEELMTLSRLDVANRLKFLIANPTLRINEKFVPAYSIPNHLNLLCYTNHPDAVRIENSDRRWLIVGTPAEPKEQSYYDVLFDKHIKSDAGPAAVKHFLLGRTVKLNSKGRAPATNAKIQMHELSLDDVEACAVELFESRTHPFDFDLLRREDLMSAIRLRVPGTHKNLQAKTSKLLRERFGAVDQSRYTNSDGRPHYRLWSIKNHDEWHDKGPAARIDAYLARTSAEED